MPAPLTSAPPPVGRVRSTPLGLARAFRVAGSPQILRRTTTSLRTAPADPLKICIQRAGRTVLHQGDVTLTLEPGQLAVYDTGRPYALRLEGAWACTVMTVPRDALSVPQRVLVAAMRHAFGALAGPGAVLTHLLETAIAAPAAEPGPDGSGAGRAATGSPGRAPLGEAGAFVTPHLGEAGALAAPHPGAAGALAAPHPGEAGALAAPHLGEAGALAAPHLGEAGALAAPHLGEAGANLLAGLISAEAGPPADLTDEALRVSVLAHIATHLGRPGLDPASVARAHHISTRTLYRLFEGADQSVAETIRGRRLDRIRADLAEPALARHPTMEIAALWGFPVQAHFIRAFHARFGMTPAAYRRRAAR
ncbi:helix-turn-helix domain-containing protein [Actinoplanes sp. NPDC051411]|uniref:helix-turn-helix domain-containing protein n=1 Tax=Actinoplanes sp. NPDC051411 TaxID=3155522 RepID=UPI0034137704